MRVLRQAVRTTPRGDPRAGTKNPAMWRVTEERVVTLKEAATRVGTTPKALARRAERGSLRVVLRDGRRMVPLAELERVFGPEGNQPSPELTPVGVGNHDGTPHLGALLARLEQLAAENGRLKALTQVAETAEAQLQKELFRSRARISELEAQLAKRGWWRRRKTPPVGFGPTSSR